MMNVVPLSHPQNILPLFPQLQLALVTEALAAGNSPGTIWVDDEDCPQSAFIWDSAHCFYYGGKEFNEAFNDSIKELLTEIVPEALHNNFTLFKVYYTSPAWKDRLFSLFEEWNPHMRTRTFYTYQGIEQEIHGPIPHYSLHTIDDDLFNSSLKNMNYIIQEIESCWCSLSRFLTHGGGHCLSDRGTIIAWCTAEYVSEKKCGVGIETLHPYERQGCATFLASTLVNSFLNKGICPHWDSWADNCASIRVAEKVGFKRTAVYSVLFGSFIQ